VPESTQSTTFLELKPGIEHLVRAQNRWVTSTLQEVERLLGDDRNGRGTAKAADEAEAEAEVDAGADDDDDDAIAALDDDAARDLAFKLLQVKRAAPKNKQFMKLVNRHGGLLKRINRIEGELMRDKQLHTADEDLFFALEEKNNVADLTEKGREELAKRIRLPLTLPDLSVEVKKIEDDAALPPDDKLRKLDALHTDYARASDSLHDIGQLLKAYSLFEKDVEYVVQDGKVMIVDEFTGRLMPGRRFSDGLHQALEAKENVRVEQETQTMASVTLQNLFRMFEKLAGMTGTAETEAEEFKKIYDLDVMVIPTHRAIRREDLDDFIYKTKREKYNAVLDEIGREHTRGMPVLVGTISVDVSETLSRMLKRRGITHEVLNARQHQREAEIVALAGQRGAVTIATNMAGRGTDIKLGPGVLCDPASGKVCAPCRANLEASGQRAPGTPKDDAEPCGLQIIGTERHESRRIDRQLRGRSGRQGDPGSSRFFMSLEDDLMRLFNPERIAAVMDRVGLKEGEVITHPMVTKAVERAQKRVEFHNFDSRQHLLKYDDVMNKQREVVYANRLDALRGSDLKADIGGMAGSFVRTRFGESFDESTWPESETSPQALQLELQALFARPFDVTGLLEMGYETAHDHLVRQAEAGLATRERLLGEDIMRKLERYAYLRAIDDRWKDHLRELDHLRTSVSLRAYGQKDPLLEYKSEAFRMFEEMLRDIERQTLHLLMHAQVSVRPPEMERAPVEHLTSIHAGAQALAGAAAPARTGPPPPPLGGMPGGPAPMHPGAPRPGPARPETVRNTVPKVGRNDACPCGSGKKYKFCHGS
jgi:preprotein translocase subunit SecA